MSSFRLYLYRLLTALIPATRMFPLKRALLRWAGAAVGKNVRIATSAKFHLTGHLTIGDNTWIGHDVMIVGGDAPVRIGKDVDIAPRVLIVTGTHEPFGLPGKAAGQGSSQPISIEDGAWLGASVTVVGGVTVGSQSIVAAGALVRNDIDSGTVVGGVPARLISTRDPSCRG